VKNNNQISDEKQTFWLAFGKILALLATLAIPLFLTRFLSKEDYGFYSQFNTVLYFFVYFFSFAMSTNLYFFFPIVNEDKKKVVIFQTFIFLFLFSLLSALFIYVPIVNSFFFGNEDLKKYKSILYFLTIIIVLTNITQPLYVVKKDVGISIWFPPLQIVLKAMLIIIFFLIIPGINSIINAIILASVLVLIIVLLYVKRSINSFQGDNLLDKNIAKEQLKYNLPIGLALAIKSFSQRFDKLISITFLSSSAYASYAIAFFGIPGIIQIYSAISQVTIVNMTKEINQGKKKEALELYKIMIIKNLSFSIPIILIVALNAKEIISFLFTNNYIDATVLFQMYLISIIFVMLGEGLILRASGHTKFYSKIFVLVAPIIIPITYFLTKYFGSYGAMTGALISIILPRIFIFKREIKIIDSNFRDFFPWIKIRIIFLTSLLMLLPVVLIKYFIDGDLLILIPISIIYLLVVFFIEIKNNIFIVEEDKLKSFFSKYLNSKF